METLDAEPKHELFHRITDVASARVRRLIVELELKEEIDFRNIDVSESAQKDFLGRGGRQIPALWTGEEMIQGAEEIEKYLKLAVEEPFPELLERFDQIAAEVWLGVKELIPRDLHKVIDEIEFFIMDEPSEEIIRDLPEDLAERPEELCGLHVGTPITQALITDPPREPVRVYIFRWATVDLLDPQDPEPETTLKEEIAITLIHEIGHYFGLDEDDVERLGFA